MLRFKINQAIFFAFLSIFLLSSTFSCVEKAKAPSENFFFSLKDYFQEEAQRLTSKQPSVLKRVERNSSKEEKNIRIQDWQKEFSLFTESDINKLSWKNSYEVINSLDSCVFLSKDSTLRTQKIVILKKDDQVKGITILNVVKNYLYYTREELSYYPDSIYEINKHQKVKLLGANDYLITGKF